MRVLARARPVPIGDATLALPALEDQLVHLVAHGMVHHAFLYNGRFLLRDLVEQALLRAARPIRATCAARASGSRPPASRRAWDVSAALTARCLPGSAVRPHGGRRSTTRLLVDRMLLQQRSPP